MRKSGLINLIDFIYPPVCLHCNSYIEENYHMVCRNCLDKCISLFFPFCSECKETMENENRCQSCESKSSLPVFALGYYVDPLKEIIHHFKYHGYEGLGEHLTNEMINIHKKLFCELEIDFVVPIPLHSHRLKSRGFNQAEILSNKIGARLEIPIDTRSLVKIRKTKDQAKLDPESRLKNVKGAFKVFGEALVNKKIVIVDDVITTGATVNEAYKVLKEAGAKPVAYCAIAIAGVD